eukprot:scaffold83553_cov25-Tisochrysis_lutea.AAC.1
MCAASALGVGVFPSAVYLSTRLWSSLTRPPSFCPEVQLSQCEIWKGVGSGAGHGARADSLSRLHGRQHGRCAHGHTAVAEASASRR